MCFCKPNIRTPFCPDCPPKMFKHIAELRKQLAAAEKDAERIDWLQTQDFDDLSFILFQDQPNDGMYGVSAGTGWATGKSLREAIDAAIAASREEKRNDA